MVDYGWWNDPRLFKHSKWFGLHTFEPWMHSRFQILLRRVLGVVRKSRGWSSILAFYCIFMSKFFEVFWRGTWGASSPFSLPPPLCAPMIWNVNGLSKKIWEIARKRTYKNSWIVGQTSSENIWEIAKITTTY
jgi:hypothetical protein